MQKHEKGQLIIILAVALVAVLGITALAVDGSMIYKERRDIQTTADSTSLAAATTASASSTCATAASAAVTKAISYASTYEGVTLVNNSTSPNRVETTCSSDGTTLDIKITVTKTTAATFAKMVARNQMTNTVASTARVTFSDGSFAGGNGLVALGTTCDSEGGIYASGGTTAGAYVANGGIYSGSCISATSSAKVLSDSQPIIYAGTSSTSFTAGSKKEYTGTNGLIFGYNAPAFIAIDSDLTISTSEAQLINGITPNITTFPEAMWPTNQTVDYSGLTAEAIAVPDCSSLTTQNPTLDWQAKTISPGYYPNGITQNSGTLTLESGIYCIGASKDVAFGQSAVAANGTRFYFMGDGNFLFSGYQTLTMNNSTIYLTNGDFKVSNGKFTADHISIYIKNGDFELSNGAYGVNMTAPDCSTSECGVGPAIKGLLLNMDKTYNTSGTITIANGGNGDHYLSGTIFAPNAKVTISGGTSTVASNVQIVAKRIDMSGSGRLFMSVDTSTLYSQDGGDNSVELLK